jgi:DNA-binding response OmpR family regulator
MPEHGSSFGYEIRTRLEVLELALQDLRRGGAGAADSLRRVARSIGSAAEGFGLEEVQRKAGVVVAASPEDLLEQGAAFLAALNAFSEDQESRWVTLLLVDDDPDMLGLLERVLSAPGRRVLTAADGSGMEAMLAEHRPDLILMDLFLPDADGRDLLLRIREDPAMSAVPVVVCSAVPAAEAKTESLALGAADYLEKPIDPGLARTVVAGALRNALARPREGGTFGNALARAREGGARTEGAAEVGERSVGEGSGEGGKGGAELRKGLKVLLVEDDPLTASLVHHRLARDGFEVHGFDDGAAAFAAVQETEPDLVLLDVKLPGMDGFEFLERLRALPRLESIPVVMLTAMGREEDIVRGLRLGANDYVLKPFSPVELSARVRRLLKA